MRRDVSVVAARVGDAQIAAASRQVEQFDKIDRRI